MDVKLQFNKDVEQDAKEYFFHPTQKGKLEQDGSYTLSLKASGEYEIITELLKWRNSVKVLAPESLKEAYKNEIRKMITAPGTRYNRNSETGNSLHIPNIPVYTINVAIPCVNIHILV